MSRVSKVEVLCPNGHRVQVNVNPNTRLLQIVEECCLKQRLGSPSGYKLKLRHSQKPVDLSLSVHLAGLTNMAKLDIVETGNQRTDVKVKVALQLEKGGRLQRDFEPLVTLWEVLESFQQDDGRGGQLDLSEFQTANSQPVVNYLTEEIPGVYALKSTMLKTLGIFEGSHLLRVSFNVISDEKLNEVREKIDKEKARLSKLAAKAACPENVGVTSSSLGNASDSGHINVISESTSPSTVCSLSSAMDVSDVPAQTNDLSGILETASGANTEICRGRTTDAALPVQMPSESEMEVSQTMDTAQDFASTSGRTPKADHRVEHFYPIYPDVTRCPQFSSRFADFKFPEETKGKELYHNEFSEVSKDDFKSCDREAVLFCRDDRQESAPCSEFDDAFYEHTASDVKTLYDGKVREVLSLTEQPLMTLEMRKVLCDAKMSRYSRVVIQFCFPDHFVLQALFRPSETVFALYKFVRQNLEDKNLDFQLYTTPPKKLLTDETQTLVEADLAPTSLVYFRTENQAGGCLATEVLKNIGTYSEAKKITDQHLISKNISKSKSEAENSTGNSASSSSQTNAGPGPSRRQPVGATSDKMPKWLKTGKK